MKIENQIVQAIGCKYEQAERLKEIMVKEPVSSYTSFKRVGITDLKAKKLFAILQIANFMKQPIAPKQSVLCSRDAYNLIKADIADLHYEEFWILLLNRKNKLMEKVRISKGGVSGTITDVRVILQEAFSKLASAMVLCHNHPSGNTKPSQADIKITKKITEVARLMDIAVLDHVIVSGNSYFSFADENMI